MTNPNPEKILQKVYNVIVDRKNISSDNSYVSTLINNGTNHILQKIGEESTEVILASKDGNQDDLIHEITDLLFHLLVLMVTQGIKLDEVLQELKIRFGKSGLDEKEQRQKSNT